MSSQSDRGMRRRNRRGGRSIPHGGTRRMDREYEDSAPAKPTMILAKPSSGDQSPFTSSPGNSQTTSSSIGSRTPEKTLIVRSRDDPERSNPSSMSSIPASMMSTESLPSSSSHPAPHILHARTASANINTDGLSHNRLSAPPEMTKCAQIIDEAQQWIDAPIEMLVDQSDFFVVGVVGPQGSGKSTILSCLAGNSPEEPYRNFIFPPQTKETKERCENQTFGVDMFVTGERVIFLDTQPVMSAAVLDRLIQQDKKIPPEFTTVENCIEIQSLQQIAFLMSVCHVIMVVQDWSMDMAFLRLLQTAEMLKPSTPSGSHESSSNTDDLPDYFPNMVFIQNKANREDFSAIHYNTLQQTLKSSLESSNSRCCGSVTMASGKLIPGLNPKTVKDSINLFLLPNMDVTHGKTSDPILQLLPEFRGHPGFMTLMTSLRQQIYSMAQERLTHTTLSEKNWFHYAARVWDAVKKSSMITEYNRLLY